MPDYKYIDRWMAQRDIILAPGFAENLRAYAEMYKKNMEAA